MEYYDNLETRSAEAREAALMAALPGQLAHAKAKAPAYAEMLAEVDPDAVPSRAALAQLPITRKSDLMQRQSPAAPFGGFATSPLAPARPDRTRGSEGTSVLVRVVHGGRRVNKKNK